VQKDKSQLSIAELTDRIMANDRAATAGQQAKASEETLELATALDLGASSLAVRKSAPVELIEYKVGSVE
jgi:hypothetical protein